MLGGMRKGRRLKPHAGELVIIGGAEDRLGERGILGEFVRLAGGSAARLLVVAVASDHPRETARVYLELFRRLGAREVGALDLDRRADGNDPQALRAVERATGVFFTGGMQSRITQTLGGTKLDAALHRRRELGLVLAGTSAGAAMMSGIMIAGGAPVATAMRAGMVELEPGLGFLPGVLIDQHFEERGRLRRLLSAVAQHPHELGLGIDEDTAVVARHDHTAEVIGRNSVTVVDAGDMTYTNLGRAERHDLLAVSGVRVHVLPAGYRFDLRNRTLLAPDAQARGEAQEPPPGAGRM